MDFFSSSYFIPPFFHLFQSSLFINDWLLFSIKYSRFSIISSSFIGDWFLFYLIILLYKYLISSFLLFIYIYRFTWSSSVLHLFPSKEYPFLLSKPAFLHFNFTRFWSFGHLLESELWSTTWWALVWLIILFRPCGRSLSVYVATL